MAKQRKVVKKFKGINHDIESYIWCRCGHHFPTGLFPGLTPMQLLRGLKICYSCVGHFELMPEPISASPKTEITTNLNLTQDLQGQQDHAEVQPREVSLTRTPT